jgi:hypothetical protein
MAGGYNMAGVVSRSTMRRKQDELWMAWDQVRHVKQRDRRLWWFLLASISLNVAQAVVLLVKGWWIL